MLWLAAPQAAAPVLLSPAAFRDRLEAVVTTVTHQPATAVDERTFRTKRADGTELTIAIDNAYAEYQAHPATLDAILARYAALLATAEQTGDVDQLVVIIRPSDYLGRTLPAGASTVNFIAARPMAGDLSFFLAVDSPETIRLAGPADLARWRLDENAAWSRAVANIRTRIGPLQPTRLGGENGLDGFGAASGLAPSLLADPTICGPTAPDGMQGQLVLVYARDMFVYAIPSDRAQTRDFWKAASREIANGRSMSHTVLTCRTGHWAVVKAPNR